MTLDIKPGYRLSRFFYAFHHDVGPIGLNPDDHRGGDIGVGAHADNGAKEKPQVFPKLEAPVGVRKGQGALDIVGHGLAGRIGKIIQGQDDNMITDAHPAVFTAISQNFA